MSKEARSHSRSCSRLPEVFDNIRAHFYFLYRSPFRTTRRDHERDEAKEVKVDRPRRSLVLIGVLTADGCGTPSSYPPPIFPQHRSHDQVLLYLRQGRAARAVPTLIPPQYRTKTICIFISLIDKSLYSRFCDALQLRIKLTGCAVSLPPSTWFLTRSDCPSHSLLACLAWLLTLLLSVSTTAKSFPAGGGWSCSVSLPGESACVGAYARSGCSMGG
ncbi:hypothetical protein IWZ01DRAFT_505914 [Phyllosticta capitalensis]